MLPPLQVKKIPSRRCDAPPFQAPEVDSRGEPTESMVCTLDPEGAPLKLRQELRPQLIGGPEVQIQRGHDFLCMSLKCPGGDAKDLLKADSDAGLATRLCEEVPSLVGMTTHVVPVGLSTPPPTTPDHASQSCVFPARQHVR